MTTTTWTQKPGPDFQIWCPEEFDMSGSNTRIPVWTPSGMPEVWGNRNSQFSLIVKKIVIAFTEATPATIGDATYDFNIAMGSDASQTAYDNFGSAALFQNKAVGDVLVRDNTDFTGDDRISGSINWLEVSCLGGASGSGRFRVCLIVSQDGTNWRNFTV